MAKAKKKNQQKSTKVNTLENLSAYDRLDLDEQLAVDLKLEGFSYFQMAAEMNRMLKKQGKYKEQTLRGWFMDGGICYEAYEWKKLLRSVEREATFKEVQGLIKEAVNEAIVTLRKRVRSGSVKAAEILGRWGGMEPAQKHELDVKKPTKISIQFGEAYVDGTGGTGTEDQDQGTAEAG